VSDGESEAAARGPHPASVDGYNAGYAELLLERELRERGAVPPGLAEWVENGRDGAAGTATGERAEARAVEPRTAADREATARRLRVAAAAGALVGAYREHGHTAARIDPFGEEAEPHASLDPSFYGVEESELAQVPASALGLEALGDDAVEVLGRLREIYCGPIGYELDHIDDPVRRSWLEERIESGDHRAPLSEEEVVALLERLAEVEGFERFLHRAYLGKKRFSIEGVDMLVPMLDEVAERAAGAGTREILLGMAHRGRLNVLTHVVGRSYRSILAEFEGEHEEGVSRLVPEDGSGDVKYHLGAAGVVETEAGRVGIYLAPNPSHLEHVNPVVEGMARAARDLRAREQRVGECGDGTPPSGDGAGSSADGGPVGGRRSVLPTLVHGDAAFMGQGVVAETLNMHRLDGYETGGTLHLIANNQLGFSTTPPQGRSTRYASDLALGFRIPVLHVNADEPEACLAAVRLAHDYRVEFGEDILVDLVGYRRHGHNEGDEPSFTQPSIYRIVEDHPTVRDQWAERLVERGVVSGERVSEMADRVADALSAARAAVQEPAAAGAETGDPATDGATGPDGDGSGGSSGDAGAATGSAASSPAGAGDPSCRALRAGLTSVTPDAETETGVDRDRLLRLNREIHEWPAEIEPLPKLDRQMQARRDSMEQGEGLDWAHAEALALASLAGDGVAVRMTGEDTERGTFSQRHLRIHDAGGGGSWVPLEHLSGAEAPFEIHNSPLSEVATLGFEYGYSAVATDSLVLWEAQFGDFANVGQAIIDQFIVAGRSKWGQESRLVLLLPHGYEGQGPEHSSARLERFLQLGGRGNIRVAYPTTPAQYFHLLRLQGLRPDRRPLVVMTPKSLLRHPLARSELGELTGGRFRPLLRGPGPEARRLLLCTGKVYYDLVGSDAHEEATGIGVVRLERLYPFPREAVAGLLEDLEGLEELVWVQEEPRNMGAWSHVRPFLRELAPDGVAPAFVGRPEMASPAEGYAAQHAREQQRIVHEALGVA